MKVIQHSYVNHADLLRGSVPSDFVRKHVTIRCCPKNPTTNRRLIALLFVGLNDERKLKLTAVATWCRSAGRNIYLDQPRLWQEILEPEDGEPRPQSIATETSA